jgi:hypothetical protein
MAAIHPTCMASSSTDAGVLSSGAVQQNSVTMMLRLEGLAETAASAALYAHTGASWWLFAALWLTPDLSMLGYLAGSCRGARIYNAAHTYTVPLALGLAAVLLHTQALLLPIALIWINHIAVDRLLGWGLKYSNGFDWTHLGRIGKARRITQAHSN